MDIIKKIAQEIGCRDSQVEAAVKLIDEGNTIPFIARYRKEATGSLNDEQLRLLHERLVYLRNLEDKKAQVIASIEEQGKLTDQLRTEIEKAETMVLVDDLYRPYRPKRKTRATIAKDKGLEGLANIIMLQMTRTPIVKEAEAYVSEEKGVADTSEAIAGAMDIIAENISDTADYRTHIRDLTTRHGVLRTTAKDPEAESVYEMYYDFSTPVSKMTGYRTLAVNRGEKEKFITVKIEAPVNDIISYLKKQIIVRDNPETEQILSDAIADSYDRLIAPAIEREIRNALTETAEDGAIKVFASNLQQLLMQPPIAGQTVLGWDPAFRTGCKLAVVDPTGKVLDTVVIFPTAPQKKVAEAKNTVNALIKKYGITLISVGNGTASRESEMVIAELISELDTPVQYVITNEAGASVYSASKLATEEFPHFDVGQRSAASIARRVQDPLAELVKIDPKAIGVGQYQHDMNQKKLTEALDAVVEDSVNMYITDEDVQDNWNLQGLKDRLMGIITVEDDFNYTPQELDEITKKDIVDLLEDRALKIYAKREEDLGQELLHEIERVVLLKVVDTKWMAHIDDMDELKKGIGLRSYGQKNPVVEYRMEGMDMFDDMVASIREDTVRMLFTIQVRKNSAAPKREDVLKPGEHHNMTVRKAKKPGRNDLCPCGSGKKYKNCCGAGNGVQADEAEQAENSSDSSEK